MFILFNRPQFGPRRASVVALLVLATATAYAQNDTPPSLSMALEAAWSLSPNARALQNRQAELNARQRAAEALLSSPPSLTLTHRNDRPASNLGLREYEAELGLPLWNPGVRGATAAQIAAERSAFDIQQRSAKLALAAQVRELAANAAVVTLERELALRKVAEGKSMAQDVQKRVTAGESARVDALLAQAAAKQASVLAAQSDAAFAQLQGQWRALTGLTQFAPMEETNNTPTVGEHPLAASAQAKARAAEARLALADADRHDPMELGVGVTRERSVFGESAQNAIRLSVRIPFGGDNRNAPRLAAARAELDTAMADKDAAVRQIEAEVQSANLALQAAKKALALASERASLSNEAQGLIAKSYQLGESDLPARLRAESERFEAELALARARVEQQRAVSRLNQAQGLLP